MKVLVTAKNNASLLERLKWQHFSLVGDRFSLGQIGSKRSPASIFLPTIYTTTFSFESLKRRLSTMTTSRCLFLWSLLTVLLLVSGQTNVLAPAEQQQEQQQQQDELEVDPSQQRRELWDFFSFAYLSTCLCPHFFFVCICECD